MIKQEEMVSIIIPVYNVENYLEECIESVLNQTYRNYEVILIDDCSTDNSLEICQKYAEVDDKIIVFHQEKNKGQSIARNIGINLASGDYIYFLDSDDFINEHLLNKTIKYMKDSCLDLCYFSGEVLLDSDGLTWNKEIYIKKHNYSPNLGIEILKQLYVNSEYTVSNCMFISKAYLIKDNNLRYHEGVLYEDNYFAFILASVARKAGVMNDVFYTRRVRVGSTMTSTDRSVLKINSYIEIIKDFNRLSYTKDKSIKKIIRSFIRGFSVSAVQEIIKIDNQIESKKLYTFFLKEYFFNDYKIFGYVTLRLFPYVLKRKY